MTPMAWDLFVWTCHAKGFSVLSKSYWERLDADCHAMIGTFKGFGTAGI